MSSSRVNTLAKLLTCGSLALLLLAFASCDGEAPELVRPSDDPTVTAGTGEGEPGSAASAGAATPPTLPAAANTSPTPAAVAAAQPRPTTAVTPTSAPTVAQPYCEDLKFRANFNRFQEGAPQFKPHWTPDGSQIVFGDGGRIYAVDANGTVLNSLSGSFEAVDLNSGSVERDFSPAVSPDGLWVAYATLRFRSPTSRGNNFEIVIQSIDGSEPRRVTRNEWHDVSPAWSPDGSRIAFVSHREDGPRVFTIAPDGSDERSVAPNTSAQPNAPVWSPDGSRLAFVAEERECVTRKWVDTYHANKSQYVTHTVVRTIYHEALYTADPDGSNLTRLDWPDEADVGPRTRYGRYNLDAPEQYVVAFQWSPDGRYIAFAGRYYGEKGGIYIANADGADTRLIIDFATASVFERYNWWISIIDIAWSADGSRISFEIGRGYRGTDRSYWHPSADVYTVAADGSEFRLVRHEDDIKNHLEWSGRIPRSSPRGIISFIERSSPEYGWIVFRFAQSGAGDRVLVRKVDNRLVAANPYQSAGADDAAACSQDHVVPGAENNVGLVNDCRLLLRIRSALAGDEVLYWSADASIHEWPGIIVDGNPPRVHGLISVPAVRLNGTIPPEIGELSELRVLSLGGGELRGSIPAELGNLGKLEVLVLGDWWAGHNELTGSIPAELGRLRNLRILNLSGNRLDGAMPPELGMLSKLEELYLGDNPFEGTIPPEFGQLVNRRMLYLGGNLNQLTGEIPPELGNLVNLLELTINWTQLSGQIPREFGNLKNLTKLHLRGSNFDPGELTGAIPRELASLESLRSLNLEYNRLTGTIPPEFGDMGLRALNLRNNLLTGCAPSKLRHTFILDVDPPFCE